MIYIFDDRAQRRKDNEEKLIVFSGSIVFATVNIIPGKHVEECIFDSMENPECIIFHKSFVFEDKSITFESIRHLFTSRGVPVVIFSGGTEGVNKGREEININADRMYRNLPYFLKDYQAHGVINIDILLWGKSYKLNALLQFQNELAREYIIDRNLEDAIENIERVKRTIRQKLLKIDKKMSDAILEALDKNLQMTWGDLTELIDNKIISIQ